LIVLDASVVLAKVFGEPGRNMVPWGETILFVSAVNYAEAVTKLADRGVGSDAILANLKGLTLSVVEFSETQAVAAGLLRATTRHLGLSLGDRCCLALAMELRAPVMTADRAWAGLDLGVEVRLIR
jgi:ribonuclease VapC